FTSPSRAPGGSSPEMIRWASQSATVRESSLCSLGGAAAVGRTGVGGVIGEGCLQRTVCCIQHLPPSSLDPTEGDQPVPVRKSLLLLAALGAAALACTAALAATSKHAAVPNRATASPHRGGSVTIDRIEDSQSFDK